MGGIVFLIIGNPAVVISTGKAWLELNRLVKVGKRLIQVAFLRIGNAAPDIGARRVWIEFNCLTK